MPQRVLIGRLSLAAVALLTGSAYVYGGVLPRYGRHVVTMLGPIALAGLLSTLYLARHHSKELKILRRLGVGVIAALGFVTLLCLPAGLRWTELERATAAIPMPSDATNVVDGIDLVCFDGVTDVARHCITPRPAAEIEQFYKRRCADAGWLLTEIRDDIYSPTIRFYRGGTGRDGRRVLSFERGHESLYVEVSRKQGETFVGVYYYDPDRRHLDELLAQ